MLKLKPQYSGHLMLRANSLEKTLMVGKTEGKRRRGQRRMRWLDSITDSMDVSLNKLSKIVYSSELNSRSLLKLMSIESVMLSNHLTLCHPLLLLPAIFPSIRVLSNESVLPIKWPKYWRFSFNIIYKQLIGIQLINYPYVCVNKQGA